MKRTILLLCSFSTQIIFFPSLGWSVIRNDGCWIHTRFLWWKNVFSTSHADVMLKESVCSHFLPTLCTLLPLSQVEVRIKARALVLRPPRIVGPVPPVQRKATTRWIETGEEKTLDVAQIVLFLPPPQYAILWFLDFCSPYFLPPASSTCNMVDIPHICHGRHGRRPCKFFLPGVNLYRFNANNWQFTL